MEQLCEAAGEPRQGPWMRQLERIVMLLRGDGGDQVIGSPAEDLVEQLGATLVALDLELDQVEAVEDLAVDGIWQQDDTDDNMSASTTCGSGDHARAMAMT